MLQGAIKAFHSATARFIVHHLFLGGPGAGTGLLYDSRPFRRVPDRVFFPLQTLAGVFRLRPGVLQVRFRRRLPSVALLLRDRVTQSFRILLRFLPLTAGIILLISALGAYLTARAYAKPLVEISGAAQRMATLDFSGQCKVARRDEIGTLAKSLNEMSAQLQQALDSLQAANAQLQQDIERERAQEKQRVEFFTAVSHELKTPLAILKGQLEGMVWQVGEYKDRDTWLRRCLQTTDRMEALVREILAAARMGSGDFSPARADLDLSALLNAVCETFRAPAQDKGLTLRLYIAPGVQGRGDRRLLEKAFANVVGNAVAYSPPGAVVTVALQDGAFTVENTGVHIAEDDLPHLFTPFYRVEKSRSRNSGGSGLGLYITKTILDRHGAACRIGNTADGVRFTATWEEKKLKIKK